MEDIDKRYQTILILWAALFLSVGSYFMFTLIAAPPIDPTGSTGKSIFIAVLAAIGTFLVVLSFPIKRKFFDRSVEQQNVLFVQKGVLIACVLCEVAGVLGLIVRLALNSNDFYLLFIISALGFVFHFPRREQLLAADSRKDLE